MSDQATAQAPPVSQDAQNAAKNFAQAIGQRRLSSGAPLRQLFVAAQSTEPPPLAKLLRGGGRGGQTRLKLYISLVWVSAKPPYESWHPARAWAALLNLDDPAGKGTRRIHDAVRDLSDRKLVTVQDRGGLPSLIRLLKEDGSGEAYESPSDAMNRLKRTAATEEALQQHRYLKIPSGLWVDGHLPQLTGKGLAMLLVLLSQRSPSVPSNPVWIAPRVADQRFRLAHTTRTSGLRELQQAGLITTKTASVGDTGAFIDFQRRRNVHTILLGTK